MVKMHMKLNATATDYRSAGATDDISTDRAHMELYPKHIKYPDSRDLFPILILSYLKRSVYRQVVAPYDTKNILLPLQKQPTLRREKN